MLLESLLVHTLWLQVSAPACLQDNWILVGPAFQTLQLVGGWHLKFFSRLYLIGVFINFKFSLDAKLAGMLNPSKLSSEEVPLFAWEWWVGVNGSIQVSGHQLNNESGGFQLVGLDVW